MVLQFGVAPENVKKKINKKTKSVHLLALADTIPKFSLFLITYKYIIALQSDKSFQNASVKKNEMKYRASGRQPGAHSD